MTAKTNYILPYSVTCSRRTIYLVKRFGFHSLLDRNGISCTRWNTCPVIQLVTHFKDVDGWQKSRQQKPRGNVTHWKPKTLRYNFPRKSTSSTQPSTGPPMRNLAISTRISITHMFAFNTTQRRVNYTCWFLITFCLWRQQITQSFFVSAHSVHVVIRIIMILFSVSFFNTHNISVCNCA